MTASVRVDGLTVRYPGRRTDAVEALSLSIEPGTRVGTTGRTGAGKSTLALAVAGFIPRVVRAAVQGSVRVDGIEATRAAPGDMLGLCGIVFATPANQLSGSKLTVREELAFGLENVGLARSAMDGRIDEVMAGLGIVHLAEREPASLSGGEQQRVAIASIVAMGPRVLILDEPTAELDPDGTAGVVALLDGLASAGTTILCVGHEQTVLDRCDRVVILDAGRIVDSMPAALDPGPLAWPVDERRHGATISVEGVGYRYPNGIEALCDVSLQVRSGEAVAIVGANGSGKTTLAKQLIGLLRPVSGRVLLDDAPISELRVQELARTVGFMFQDPGDQLFERSVEREVSFGPRQLGRSAAEADALVSAALAMTGLTDERVTNPYDLDRSIRKLVTLAGVLAMDPTLLVLDEPTTGLDPDGVERVGRIVRAMNAAGRTVVAITHDMDFAARWFDRTVVMRAGRAVDPRPPGA
jgi:energy-coupling factor transporter ATP-binding protein EcfA2